jgi:hypothetical protein
MRNFLRHHLDPRQESLWRLLLACGVAFRFWNVLVYRNPMNLIFSDAARHVDNARHFLDPNPMGASNPFFYQFFLWAMFKLTHEAKPAMGVVAAWLSILYPFCWYLFAAQVTKRRITALRYASVISFLPTHVSMFSFFMNETLLYPLLGLAFWATSASIQKRSARWFILASFFWVLAVLTRSVVLPIGGLAMLWAWWRQQHKVVTAFAGVALVCIGFGIAAKRAYPLLHRYTPFGDNTVVAIYFVSAAHSYQVNYFGKGTYGFASPSLYISPFEPFYMFKSARQGAVKFSVDPKKNGEDVKATLAHELELNRDKLPRMILENLLFLSFSHSWPDSGKENTPGRICLWERWIWFPLIVISFARSLVYVKRRGVAIVPVLAMLFTVCLYASQATIMEGRYRKPLEPLVMLAVFWLAEAKFARPRARLPAVAAARAAPAAPA